NGQAEILGTHLGNSAFHATKIDVDHLSSEMVRFFDTVERRHKVGRAQMADSMLFVSHETFTPARGGSAAAEITALKSTFPDHYGKIHITNTKGYTGHTLGAALEDAIMVKAMRTGTAPPIANLRSIPAEFADLNFTTTKKQRHYEYGLHLAAGFGSHFSFLCLRRIEEKKCEANKEYTGWLRSISGNSAPSLKVIHGALCVEPTEEVVLNTASVEPAAVLPDAAFNPLDQIQGIIAEQTGYTPDMLGIELDLEADLGIDTVKQVEIFARISDHYNLAVPQDMKLSELNTIAKLSEYIRAKADSQAPAASSPVEAAHVETGGAAPLDAIREIIAEQTGYTSDMLESELDLEADLGIDTVKQVEIFARISDHYNLAVPQDMKLSALNTIAKLSEYIRAATSHEPAAPVTEAPVAPALIPEAVESASPIARLIVTPVRTPRPLETHTIFSGRTFLMTLDSHGFAAALTTRITDMGGTVLTLGRGGNCELPPFNPLHDTWSDRVGEYAATVSGPISGIIHLAPLDAYFANNRETPRDAIQSSDSRSDRDSSIKGFFVLLKALLPHLRHPDTLVATMGFNSIVFPYAPGKRPIHPTFAGLSGMLKTLNKDLPGTLVKAVDFDFETPLERIGEITELFIAELTCGCPKVETGYTDKERYTLSLSQIAATEGEAMVTRGDTLLVTGGGRGITFAILEALVAKYHTNLIILGRSDLEAVDPRFLAPEATKTSIFELLKTSMAGEKPVAVRNALERVERVRETLRNLSALRERGVSVTYHSVDVTDAKAVASVLAPHAEITGILHGAGLDESQIFEKKSLASFNRVFDTKISGMENCLAACRERPLQYVIAFSSVTARFGNEGQIDYTAANDMLGKILQAQAMEHPGRRHKVVAWTAWEGTGMATDPTVHKVLEQRKLTFLPMAEGVSRFMQELLDPALEAVISGM
ncbi:SDR family NAD(P)-dependent oxidoreductase, partial [Myxococcota bacterium]|nr:SDR family NAD(P)-dependent oxidoreductase [Myxococcota bacterium]